MSDNLPVRKTTAIDFSTALRLKEDFEPPRLSSIRRALFFARALISPPKFVKGFDKSRWNPAYSYDVGDEIKFVIIKSTQGAFHVDPMFSPDWQLYLDGGTVVLVYHMFDYYKGVDQADHCLTTIQPLIDAAAANGQIVIVFLDIELDDGLPITLRQDYVFDFLAYIRDNHRKPGVYCSHSKWQKLMANVTLGDYIGWAASWTNASYPYLPVGWTDAQTQWWQNGVYPVYPWTYPVPGISGSIDNTLFRGSYDQFLLAVKDQETPPPPTPETWLQVTVNNYNIRNRSDPLGQMPPETDFGNLQLGGKLRAIDPNPDENGNYHVEGYVYKGGVKKI